jgi:hypothetical protein
MISKKIESKEQLPIPRGTQRNALASSLASASQAHFLDSGNINMRNEMIEDTTKSTAR